MDKWIPVSEAWQPYKPKESEEISDTNMKMLEEIFRAYIKMWEESIIAESEDKI